MATGITIPRHSPSADSKRLGSAYVKLEKRVGTSWLPKWDSFLRHFALVPLGVIYVVIQLLGCFFLRKKNRSSLHIWIEIRDERVTRKPTTIVTSNYTCIWLHFYWFHPRSCGEVHLRSLGTWSLGVVQVCELHSYVVLRRGWWREVLHGVIHSLHVVSKYVCEMNPGVRNYIAITFYMHFSL